MSSRSSENFNHTKENSHIWNVAVILKKSPNKMSQVKDVHDIFMHLKAMQTGPQRT